MNPPLMNSKSTKRKRSVAGWRPRHRGFTLVETLLALVALVAVSGYAMEVHQARMKVDRIAMDRLTRRLQIENIAQQFAGVDFAEIPSIAKEMAAPNAGTTIDVERFEASGVAGWHITIAAQSASGPLHQHLWRMESTK